MPGSVSMTMPGSVAMTTHGFVSYDNTWIPPFNVYGTWVRVVLVLSSSVRLGSVGTAMWSLRFVAGDIFCCIVWI